jgi:hypothetical protein
MSTPDTKKEPEPAPNELEEKDLEKVVGGVTPKIHPDLPLSDTALAPIHPDLHLSDTALAAGRGGRT